MVDRVEIAERFIQEQLTKRDDLIGAFVVGSVARGEASESSDIDLSLVVEDKAQAGGEIERGGIDSWVDEIYLEAAIFPSERYTDLEKVLQSPVMATHMNDALILHDPTGFFTQMQTEVRAVFMEAKWLGIRVRSSLSGAQKATQGLQDAIAAGDSFGVCQSVMGTLLGLASVPLLRVGITPSSMRALVQLGEVSGGLKERISEWGCSTEMSKDDVLALLPCLVEAVSFVDSEKWGHLPEYAVRKMAWMINADLHREALHSMWIGMGVYGGEWRQRRDLTVKSKESVLVQDWLRGVGWEGRKVLEGKMETAKSILEEVEELASNLPAATISKG